MPNQAVNPVPSTTALVLTCLALVLAPDSVFASAKGPTAVFNEAVRVVNGVRTVQLPPFAHDDRIEVSGAHLPPLDGPEGKRTGTFAEKVYMVETDGGLVECVSPMPHQKLCRPSTYGQFKLKRTWTVLRGGSWQNCSDPKRIVAPIPVPNPAMPKDRVHYRIDRNYHCKPFSAVVETLPGGRTVVWFGVLGIDPPTKVQ